MCTHDISKIYIFIKYLNRVCMCIIIINLLVVYFLQYIFLDFNPCLPIKADIYYENYLSMCVCVCIVIILNVPSLNISFPSRF